MVIYFDILLAVNWLVDYFLLLLSAHFLHLPVKRFRFLLGGFAGAAASLTIFLTAAKTGGCFCAACLDSMG